jgi:hypothetical protein
MGRLSVWRRSEGSSAMMGVRYSPAAVQAVGARGSRDAPRSHDGQPSCHPISGMRVEAKCTRGCTSDRNLEGLGWGRGTPLLEFSPKGEHRRVFESG